jgi:inorganic pyrophosphatase
MIDYLTIPTFASSRSIHVVVETPRNTQAKFKYEPTLRAFVLSRALTLGLSYPYDWGFVPSTLGPDGDPLDALVLHNVTTSPGVILRCRPIAVLKVLQSQNRKSFRNDRLMVVPQDLKMPAAISSLPASMRRQAEEFFEAAVFGTAKKLNFLGWGDAKAALASVRKAQKAFQRD